MRPAMDRGADRVRHAGAHLLRRSARELVDCPGAAGLGPGSGARRGPLPFFATKTQAAAAALLGAASGSDRSDVARAAGGPSAIGHGGDYSSGIRRTIAFGVSPRGR